MPPPRRVAQYELLSRLGAGGMGEVWRARDRALDRPAAVKLLRESDEHLRERLIRESRTLARLQHPAIATFYEAGSSDGELFLAMELVEGESLRSRLDRGPMEVEEAVAVARSLLSGLGHAHKLGVLHRDIKPGNVMLPATRAAKLLDFGLAKLVVGDARRLDDAPTVAQLTGEATVVGTVGYMAPEQLRGEELDARTDLFAVGVVLYEMLTGRPAFAGATPMARMAAVLSSEGPPIETGSIPPELGGVVGRALARRPEDRFVSAREMSRALVDSLSAENLVAAPAGSSSVAFLDFDNLSPDPSDAWMGTGVSRAVAAALDGDEALEVVPRHRVARAVAEFGADPEAAGEALGCGWVVAGSVQRAGPRVRIIAELVEVSTGRQVRSETLDGAVEEIFALQDEIAGTLRGILSRTSSPEVAKSGLENLSVFEAMTRASQAFSRLEKDALDDAEELFEKVLAVEPGHAEALAGLAGVHAMRYPFTTDPSELTATLAAAGRAIAADPDLGEPWIWRAYALLRQDRLDAAFEAAGEAQRLLPDHPLPVYFQAVILASRGEHAAAAEALRRCLERGSDNPLAWLGLATSLVECGDLEAALAAVERAVELEAAGAPNATPGSSVFAAEILRRQGRLERARQRALAGIADAEASDHMYRDTFRSYGLCALGRIARDEGDEEAERVAFVQARAHLEGRTGTLGGGFLLVESLAALAGLDRDPSLLDEARRLDDQRDGLDFHFAWGLGDTPVERELALAAKRLAGGRGTGDVDDGPF